MEIDWFNTLMGIYLIWWGLNYGKKGETND